MSLTVNAPASIWRASTLVRSCGFAINSPTGLPSERAICSTTGYDSGWTAVQSSGFSPSRMRRKPAACSYGLAPMPGTLLSCFRDRSDRSRRGKRRVGGGVNAGTGLTDRNREDVVEGVFAQRVTNEGIGLARCRAVADGDGDGADVVLRERMCFVSGFERPDLMQQKVGNFEQINSHYRCDLCH